MSQTKLKLKCFLFLVFNDVTCKNGKRIKISKIINKVAYASALIIFRFVASVLKLINCQNLLILLSHLRTPGPGSEAVVWQTFPARFQLRARIIKRVTSTGY